MIDFDEQTVTAAVTEQLAATPNARLRELTTAAVRHLHAFAREVDLRPEEWLAGLQFLTAVGKACTPEHQEFVLLSDTMGLSTLVNLLQDRRGAVDSTRGSVLGPFYRDNPPHLALGETVARVHQGEEVVLHGRVLDQAGETVAGATLDVWLSDEQGQYDIQAHGPEVIDLRARFTADADGRYWFRSTVPIGYSIPMGGPVGALVRATARAGMRPAHFHFLITAPGHDPLVTSLYLEGDPYLQTDAAFGVTRDLVVRIQPAGAESPLSGLPHIPYDFQLTRRVPH